MDNVKRREFLKIAGSLFAASAGVGGMYDGLTKIDYAETKATELHPNERKVYERLGVVSSKIDSAIYNLDYRAPYTTTICHSTGKVTSCTPIHHPAKYPRPADAKKDMNSALEAYREAASMMRLARNAGSNKIDEILVSVNGKVPDKEEIIESREVFESEKDMLGDALAQSNKLRGMYEAVLYKEVEPVKNQGWAEFIISPFVILAGVINTIYEWSKTRDD